MSGAPPVVMSRTRNALTIAAFNYGHIALSLLVSFGVTPYVVHRVGGEPYGAWLASIAFFGYAALADLGVYGIYPWLVAGADGRRDEERLRALVGQGPWLGLAAAGLYALAAGLLWLLFPLFVQLAEPLRAAALTPIGAYVAITILAYPLRWAIGAVYGLQDAAWSGAANVLQPLVQLVVIVGFTRAGHGLLGLAIGTAGAPLVASAVTFLRLRASRPGLAKLARAPDRALLGELFREGSGAWLGAVGWLLASASDLVVLTNLGLSTSVAAAYALTARLPSVLMNLAWALPDSANVGLAHLKAEGSPDRVRSVVATLALAHLLLIGGVSCLVLCVNATFVPLWVGAQHYGGEPLTLLFVADVVLLSAGHALLVPMGVLGHRHAAGLLQLCASLLQIGLALGLGRAFGPAGVAAGRLLSTAILVLPVGAVLIRRFLGPDALRALGSVALRWLPRWAPVAVACWWAGRTVIPRAGWAGVVLGGALAGVAYLVALRPLFRELPWGGRMGGMLRRLRVI